MNSDGQGFSVFRLLISAIMGLMILVIILSIASYFQNIKIDQGLREIANHFEKSTHKPDGTVFVLEKVDLPAGTIITSVGLSQNTNVPKDCIEITGNAKNIEYSATNKGASILKDLAATIYFQCQSTGLVSGCDISCIVSINQKLE